MAYSSSSFFCSESFVGWRIISPFGEVAGFLPFFFRYLTDMMSLPFGEASTDASGLPTMLNEATKVGLALPRDARIVSNRRPFLLLKGVRVHECAV